MIYRPTLLLFPYVPNNIIRYYYHHHRIHRSALSRPPDLQLLQQSYIHVYVHGIYDIIIYHAPCDGAVTDFHDLHARGLNLNGIAICTTLKTGFSDTQ